MTEASESRAEETEAQKQAKHDAGKHPRENSQPGAESNSPKNEKAKDKDAA